jgi:glutamate N-acetyltransferase/amino-acid N-acetyltransferase
MAPSRVLIVALASSSSTVSAFLPRPILATRPLTSSTCRFSCSSTTDTDTPAVLPTFDTKEDYLSFLQERSQLPKGFATGTAKGTFVSQEAPAMGKLPISGTVIHLTEGPTENWAAVFTKNKFPGAPIIVGRARLASGNALQALVINNKVSNVCSGGDGVADAEQVCEAVAQALQLPGGAASVLPSSTGVIGWRVPAKELAQDVVPQAVKNLQTTSGLNAAEAIMTTDRYPKLRSKTLSNGARIVGIAKGAGMIEPNMATMLAYIMTDATVPRPELQKMLTGAVNQSFNSISIDGDESTSDTCVAICSNQYPQGDLDEFKDALNQVCLGLSSDLVRNGEGTAHVMRVQIDNFPGSDFEARRLGRHICNSPLFKCAVSGNDPNTGRLAGAIGSFMGKFKNEESVSSMSLTLGGRTIFSNGKFVLEGDDVEKELSNHMKDAQLGEEDEWPRHQKFVEIGVDFANGSGSATVLGSDLTAEYVAVNADYRS